MGTSLVEARDSYSGATGWGVGVERPEGGSEISPNSLASSQMWELGPGEGATQPSWAGGSRQLAS